MKELLKKFGAFSIGPMAAAVISLITVPLITHFISPAEYGRTSMFTLAQGMLSMLMYMGMDQAFVREFNATKEQMSKLMTNAVAIPAVIVLVLDIIIVVNAELVSYMLFDNNDEYLAVWLLALMLPFMIISHFSLLKIRMEEKGVQYSFFTILLKVVILILTVILFALYEKNFRSVVYAMAVAEIINGSILYVLALRPLKLNIKNLEKNLINKMLAFGLPLIPASILSWVLTSMDKVMLRTMCDYGELGLYTAAFKIVSVLSIVQTCFTLFWTPVAYRWYEEKVDNKQFELVNKLVAAVMTAMCMGILIFKDVVAFILGEDFAAAIYIFPFILLNPIMYTMSEATAVGIGFSRKTHYTIIVSASSGILNIVLNYLLIPLCGSVGAAIATGISYIVFFWVRTLISRKLWYAFPIKDYVVYTILILINGWVNTFVIGLPAYLTSIVSLILVGIYNYKSIIQIISLIKRKDR